MELVLRAAFETIFSVTKGPNVMMYQRFQSAWSNIDTSKYKSGMDDETASKVLQNKVENIKLYVENSLEQTFARDDYREFLELVLVFFGFSVD